jgi:hypothetical protein
MLIDDMEEESAKKDQPAGTSDKGTQHDQNAYVVVRDAVQAILENLRARQKQNNERDDNRYRLEKWALFVAAIYAGLTFGLLLYTRASLKVAENSLIITNRAWVLFDKVDTAQSKPGVVTFKVVLKNFGHGPAFSVGRRISVREVEPTECADFDWSDSEHNVIAPDQDTTAGFTIQLAPQGKEQVFWIYGRVKYSDHFGNFRETCFCRVIEAATAYTGTRTCPNFNWAN